MNRARLRTILLWVVLNTAFWAVVWSVTFSGLYGVWANEAIEPSLFKGFLAGGAVGGAGLGLLEARVFGFLQRQDAWGRSVIFWVVYWVLVFPLFATLIWAIVNRDCNCDGNLMCLCPPANFLLGMVIAYLFLWVTVPGYFVVAVVGSLLWGWLFQRLVYRFF
ncbi:hypothetical protein [Pseudanabaena sp. FACHB-2040]|uniref:hypothetical protein n=1 Tax=Pseudanabaena sp. FACHB-2040 TaxID=2692859 RepID=UPI001687B241|nr:hypothetical protein [Pseudanabaena sp. FACHB-2040]MBD2256529.1 hypothetical protein [Pseudanabaena sp. FACHB-2040]